MNWNAEKEEKRRIWHLLGFNDGEIGALSEPFVSSSSVCLWRLARRLPPNSALGCRQRSSSNKSNKALSDGTGRPLSEERQELLLHLYNEGLNDPQIAKKVGRKKASVRRWRLRKGLPANVSQGGQAVKEGGHKIQKKTRKAKKKHVKKEPKDKSRENETKKEPKLSARKLAEQEEAVAVGFLPTKEEILKMVKNSPRHKVTTKQLIKQGYGDVGSKSRDTVGKLRELADKDKKLVLDTSGKEIIWIWTA